MNDPPPTGGERADSFVFLHYALPRFNLPALTHLYQVNGFSSTDKNIPRLTGDVQPFSNDVLLTSQHQLSAIELFGGALTDIVELLNSRCPLSCELLGQGDEQTLSRFTFHICTSAGRTTGAHELITVRKRATSTVLGIL